MIHYNFKEPISGYINEKYLYNMDEEKNNWLKCNVIGISSYPNNALTFNILLDDEGNSKGSLFCYMPFDSFTTDTNNTLYNYKDLIYHNCPFGKLTMTKMNLPSNVNVYLKTKKCWIPGKYFITLDWYDGNDLLHLIHLSNGQLCAMPNHKIKFGDNTTINFNRYKKLKYEWVI